MKYFIPALYYIFVGKACINTIFMIDYLVKLIITIRYWWINRNVTDKLINLHTALPRQIRVTAAMQFHSFISTEGNKTVMETDNRHRMMLIRNAL